MVIISKEKYKMEINFRKTNPRTTKIREVALILFISLAGLMMHLGVRAADTDTVSATVTAEQISLSVSDANIAYGVVGIGESVTTLDVGETDTQTITNTGNVVEDFHLQGTDSTSWTLAGSTGNEQYTHEYSIDGGGTWAGYLNNSSYTEIVTGIGTSATQDFDLRLTTPDTTDATDEQSVDVSVQATAN